jgi:hypothetical protein
MTPEPTLMTKVYFGKPAGTNPEHLANVMIRFYNGEYIRGVMIYRKTSILGQPYFLLRYPSYVNSSGSQVPFFRLSPKREQKVIDLFLKAFKRGRFLDEYPLSCEDVKPFSKVLV